MSSLNISETLLNSDSLYIPLVSVLFIRVLNISLEQNNGTSKRVLI